MKKLLFILLSMLLLGGCSSNTVEGGTQIGDGNGNGSAATVVAPEDLVGYWLQVEADDSGDITDLKDNPYAYLEITEERLFFYTLSLNEGEGYGVSEKYYILEEDKMYFDYYELTGADFKENLDPMSGGVFTVSFDGADRLVLTILHNGENTDGGYDKDTYIKIPASDWPIEE